MAQLNFPNPAVSTTYTAAGITWTWNSTLELWSTESGGGGGANVSVGENAPNNPSEGDLWYADDDSAEFGGRLYIYIDSQWVDASLPGGGDSGSAGGSNVHVSPTPPSSPEVGDLWWNSDDTSNRLYVYYFDGDSSQWVEASPQGGGGGDSSTEIISNGAAAWGKVSGSAARLEGLNFTVSQVSTGNYRITFTNPMPNENYSVTLGSWNDANDRRLSFLSTTANGFDVRARDENGAVANSGFSFAVHALNAQPPKGGTGADAWCSTSVDGTVPASFNIASVTKTATGIFDYVFTTPMPNASYTVVATPAAEGAIARTCAVSNKEVTGFRIEITNLEGNKANESHYVIVHATNAQLPDTITQEELDTILDLAENPPNGYGGAAAWGVANSTGALSSPSLNLTVSRIEEGRYQCNFINPVGSNNYSVQATAMASGSRVCAVNNRTANGFQVNIQNTTWNLTDSSFHVAVHASNALPPRGGTGADGWAITQSDGTLDAGFNFVDANVVRSAAGTYDYTFTTPMPSADYAVVGMAFGSSSIVCRISSKTTTGFRLKTQNNAGSSAGDDADTGHSVIIHATNAQLPDTITQEELDAALNSPGVSAWGTTTVGGGLINHLNISGMTNDTTGEYVYTFATPMPNNRYSIGSAAYGGGTVPDATVTYKDQLPTGFTLIVCDGDGTKVNSAHSFAIHATNAPAPKGGTGADGWLHANSLGVVSASYNIATTTSKTSTGVYEYTFTTPMPSAEYGIVATAANFDGTNSFVVTQKNRTTTGFTIQTNSNDSSTPADCSHAVVIYATNATLPAPLTQDDLLFVDGRNASTKAQGFQDGISVTGGRNITVSNDASPFFVGYNNGSDLITEDIYIARAHLQSQGTSANNIYIYSNAGGTQANTTGTLYGYHSSFSSTDNGGRVYNFYAHGSAPNFFSGPIIKSLSQYEHRISSTNSVYFAASASASAANAPIEIMGVNHSANPRTCIAFSSSANADGSGAALAGNIQVDVGGAGVNYNESSDYRLKSNIQALSQASELVKQLKPCSFEIRGINRRGFIAHELQQIEPTAVTGTKDEEEAIGTHTDAAGVVTADVPEPEAMPYGDTWVQTGTRPVYQGVDVSKLIPLLTKALQEALDKIETLETRLSDAGIA